MKKRNPFYLRATEQITDDLYFFKYFSPEVLDLFGDIDSKIWNKPLVIRSSPGGGKSSLFRAFSIELLSKIIKHKDSGEDYRYFFKRMEQLGVTKDKKIKVFGLILSCARNYSILDDYGFEKSIAERLFIALMNARILLSVLRHMASVHKIDFPDGLAQIKFNLNSMDEDLPYELKKKNIKSRVDGKVVYEWAIQTERKIFNHLDSTIFSNSVEETNLPEGNSSFFAFSLLKERNIFVREEELEYKYLLMFDDVQKLTKNQRKILREALMDIRPSLSIWLAERTEAISPEELFALGSIEGRDYNETVNLEERWSTANFTKVTNFYSNIAKRRLQYSTDAFENMEFKNFLGGAPDTQNVIYKSKLEELKKKNHILFSSHKYKDWVSSVETKAETENISLYGKLFQWKKLEILIAREERKKQPSLGFELAEEELNLDASNLNAATEFLLAREFNFPYYFGFESLVKVSSYNVEQFLLFSGELFENVSAKHLIDDSFLLDPEKQEKILIHLAKKKWEEIPKRVPNGRVVQNFLELLAEFAKKETNLPNAPYPPGVTGIGIKTSDKEILKKSLAEKESMYREVASILYTCISQNLFEVKNKQKQGNSEWTILYFNRWLCVYFKLPLGYGGWRSKNLNDLEEIANKSVIKT